MARKDSVNGKFSAVKPSLDGSCDPFQLFASKFLKQSGLGIDWPIHCADAALLITGGYPINKFLIGKLVGIAHAMIDVAAIDFTMPKNPPLGRQLFRS